MERIVQPDSLALIDRVIYDLQAALSSVEWLTNIFGRARRQVRRVKGREVFFPAVYVGGGEYRSVLPDEMDGNFVWFDVPDYYTADIPPKQYGSVSATIRMVFWFDEETIFGRGISNRDRLKENVLAALRRALIRGGRFTVSRIGELNENIYRGYSIREIEAQHLIFPHGGFVVEGTAVAEERCGPYVPPVYVDTTDGTITPETVLIGEVGYAKGQRIVGTLDMDKLISEATEHGEEIGQSKILESQSDADITADKVLSGYIGYGPNNTRVVGNYIPAPLISSGRPAFAVKGKGSAIDTGFVPTEDTEVCFTLFIEKRTRDTFQSFEFGSRSSSTAKDAFALYFDTSANDRGFLSREWTYVFGDKKTFTEVKPIADSDNLFKFNKTGSWFNGVKVVDIQSVTMDRPKYPLYLMGNNNAGSINSLRDRFYYWRGAYIEDKGIRVRDFIPWIDDDGRFCFRELIEEKLYYPLSGLLEGKETR